MEMSALVDAYLDGPGTLRQAVAGLSREQLVARPVPGKWSTLEVVCHLADFEPVYADRMKRVLAEHEPILFSADEQRYAAVLAYHDRDLDEELTLIETTRRQLARILRAQPSGALSRIGTYRRDGNDEPRTLEKWLTLITGHIAHHVPFIIEKRRAMGLSG